MTAFDHFVLAMGTPAQGAPSPWVQLMPFALVLAIFYFVILLPMKRKQQKFSRFSTR
jgi:preprotein translocase subunit YajC